MLLSCCSEIAVCRRKAACFAVVHSKHEQQPLATTKAEKISPLGNNTALLGCCQQYSLTTLLQDFNPAAVVQFSSQNSDTGMHAWPIYLKPQPTKYQPLIDCVHAHVKHPQNVADCQQPTPKDTRCPCATEAATDDNEQYTGRLLHAPRSRLGGRRLLLDNITLVPSKDAAVPQTQGLVHVNSVQVVTHSDTPSCFCRKTPSAEPL
jgi:hypothetical protein